MDSRKDSEYVFWLDGWTDQSRVLANTGQYKCVVSESEISIVSLDGDHTKEKRIDVRLIQDLRFEYPINSVRRFVKVVFEKGSVTLFPIHPFDPRHVLHTNHEEAKFMLEVIKNIKSNLGLEVNPNPYLRYLTSKNNAQIHKFPVSEMDKHVPPWIYYNRYGDKFLWPKIIVFIAFLVVTLVIIALAIAYVLDTLSVI